MLVNPIGGGSGPSESNEGVVGIDGVAVEGDEDEEGALGLINAAIENRLDPRPGFVFPFVAPSTSTPSNIVPGLGDFLFNHFM